VRREADRKLEHMTTQSLLVLAHGVHLGYGQYLKEEFEKGTINKEGLIKVLKARAKGKDFSREYREQAAHYRLLKSSPEFLHEDRLRMALPPVNPNDGAPIQDISSPLPPHVNSAKDVSPTQPLAAAIPRSATTTDEPHNENDAKKSDANNLWIIAIIIGVIILSLLLWTLFK
jgi:hypothetical protein